MSLGYVTARNWERSHHLLHGSVWRRVLNRDVRLSGAGSLERFRLMLSSSFPTATDLRDLDEGDVEDLEEAPDDELQIAGALSSGFT